MENIEFRVSPDGKVFFKENGEEEKRLTRFNKNLCVQVLGMISERFPGAWSRLRLIYKPKSKTHAEQDKAAFKIVERLHC